MLKAKSLVHVETKGKVTPTPQDKESPDDKDKTLKPEDKEHSTDGSIPSKPEDNTMKEAGDESHILPEIRAVMIKRSLCVISNPIPNCSAHYRGDCIECESDYHLLNNICKPLAEENRIMFCHAYNQKQKCVKCKPGFILVSGKCIKFKQVINCRNQVYYPNGKCLICKHGHIFDKEENKCVSREQMYFKQKAKEESQDEREGHEEKHVDSNGEDIGFDRHCLLVRDNSNKSCFMCRPGYYMDKQGNCFFSEEGYKKKWLFW